PPVGYGCRTPLHGHHSCARCTDDPTGRPGIDSRTEPGGREAGCPPQREERLKRLEESSWSPVHGPLSRGEGGRGRVAERLPGSAHSAAPAWMFRHSLWLPSCHALLQLTRERRRP